MLDVTKVPSPCYVMEEDLLRKNLSLIKSVAERAGVEIILAFKAFAMWKSFPIFREYIHYTTASSEYEARLAFEEFGSKAHTYSPAYTEANFPAFLKYSSPVKTTFPIGQHYLITHRQTQHSQAMSSLFFGQFRINSYIRSIKYMHIL